MMLAFQNLITKLISVDCHATHEWQRSAKGVAKIFPALMLLVGAGIYHGDPSFFIQKPNNVKNEYNILYS